MVNNVDLYDLRHVQSKGDVEMVIFGHGDRVIQRFREQTDFVSYELPNAVAVGKQFIDEAVNRGANVTLQVPKRKITEEQRVQMILRAGHIMRSELEKNRHPEAISRAIVDHILAMVD